MKCGCGTIRPESAPSEQVLPRDDALDEGKRTRKRRARQAESTASANLQKRDRIWNVWGIASRSV